MALQGGDREFGHGDQVTVVYDDGTDAVGGEAVSVTGRAATEDHVTVALEDTDSQAIIADGATQGEPVQAVFHGFVWVRVDGDYNADATLNESTGGVFTSPGDGSGEYTIYEGTKTDSESGENIALIRYEN